MIKSQKCSQFFTSTTPISAEGRARTAQSHQDFSSTTLISAEVVLFAEWVRSHCATNFNLACKFLRAMRARSLANFLAHFPVHFSCAVSHNFRYAVLRALSLVQVSCALFLCLPCAISPCISLRSSQCSFPMYFATRAAVHFTGAISLCVPLCTFPVQLMHFATHFSVLFACAVSLCISLCISL